MNKPNIFNYATSELSQDAIICYILEWTKIENKAFNENLHTLGIDFLSSLFEKFKDIETPNEYQKIEIIKQYENIDVLCIINDEYSIIIEDKTNTKNHSDQLKRYFDKVSKNFSKTKVLPIYFKTGDQSNYKNVEDNGYKIYLRKDFLNILTSVKYSNDIIEIIQNTYKILKMELIVIKQNLLIHGHGMLGKAFTLSFKKNLKMGTGIMFQIDRVDF